MDDQRQILTYELGAELGHDRLGRVFRAVDTRNQRSVVLRLMRVGALVPSAREEAVRVELRRMMRSVSNVAHPNLAPIVDIASYRDLEIVAWDDFGGAPLADRLEHGAPATEGLRWAIETASAIARAHSRDVPHGRISLGNIRVARDDGVRVLDLGVPRPRAIPFLVEDEPDAAGVLRPARRNISRLLRRDLDALADVVRQIVSIGPAHAPDAAMRDEIMAAVDEACAGVLVQPRPTVAQLHLALVEVARRTPSDGRRPGGRLAPPRRSAVADGAAASPPPESTSTPVTVPPLADDPVPFALSDYENTKAGGLRRTGAAGAPPLRVWGAAAFELEEDEPEDEEVVASFDPREPPLMKTVLLPPLAPGERTEPSPDPGRDRARARLWPQFAIAVIIGLLVGFAVFAIDQALRGPTAPRAEPPLAVSDGAGLRPPDAVTGSSPATLSAAPRPVARPGQTAGTLVISVNQPDVQVSVDDTRAETAPVTWDDLPAGRRVVRLSAPGFQERVDTVDVRPNLTTTRFYILTPIR